MIQKFPASFSTPSMDFWKDACMTLKSKEAQELKEAFQFLGIWGEHFESIHGELQAISHLSNPDDPPDVIAHFTGGDLSIEVTSIEPPHIHQSDALDKQAGQGRGRSGIPISIKPTSKEEAMDFMYLPGGGPCEDVGDRNQVWGDSIIKRASKKLDSSTMKQVVPGVILLTGGIEGSFGEKDAITHAFSAIRQTYPEGAKWCFATCYQWNSIQFYSTLSAPSKTLMIKSSESTR
ncbi:MAG: hypothetical protein QNL68_09880 [Akkermansiaceae bacterium]